MGILVFSLVANAVCVLGGFAALRSFLGTLSKYRSALVLPIFHAGLCLVAGLGSFVWSVSCEEPMYTDACPLDLLNPAALFLMHANAWRQIYPAITSSRMVHFLVLPAVAGIVSGCFAWLLIGLGIDRVSFAFRKGSGSESDLNTPG
jgi:hypothetical protein